MWKKYCQKFPKFVDRHTFTDPKISVNAKLYKFEENHAQAQNIQTAENQRAYSESNQRKMTHYTQENESKNYEFGGFPDGPMVKNLPCNVRHISLIPGPERPHMPWNS